MADQKPPRLVADERATLLALLQYQRDSFVRKVSGVSHEQARSSPLASGTSLLWLTNHMADAEATWVLHRFAGRRDDCAGPAATDVAEAVLRYQRVWRDVDGVIDGVGDLDVECPPFDSGPPVNMRWILGHLLEETARHAGHADILRELIDGQTGR